MTSPGNHILPHYDAALNAIRLRVNAICGSLLKYMDILERVISGPDSDGANSIIADSDPLQEETRQVLSLCSSVLTQFHPLGRDLRLVITFSRCGDKLQECMEEVTGIAKHAKASIRHQESLSPEREDSPSLNVNLLFIIRSLERIGDIAKTIAATVVFLKEATDIRHGKER